MNEVNEVFNFVTTSRGFQVWTSIKNGEKIFHIRKEGLLHRNVNQSDFEEKTFHNFEDTLISIANKGMWNIL